MELQRVRLLHLAKNLQDVCFLLEEGGKGLHGGGRSTRARGGVLCAVAISLQTERDPYQNTIYCFNEGQTIELIKPLRVCTYEK